MYTEYRRILVPLDGSDVADSAIPVAKLVARLFNSTLRLMTVLSEELEAPKTSAPGVTSSGGQMLADSDNVPESAANYLDDVERDMVAAGLRSSRAFPFNDDIASEVILSARDVEADLIVMATRGRSGVAIGLLSPITDRVLHSSSIPVLVVPRTPDLWTLKTLVVPLDGSALAERVLPHAETIAEKADASISLVRIATFPPRYGRDPYGGVPPELLTSEKDVSAAERYLAEVSTRLRARGHRVDPPRALRGHPGQLITDIARETPGALLAISTRGTSGLTRWVMGCVADTVIRSSGVPVLVIPPLTGW